MNTRPSPRALKAFLDEAAAVVGSEWVLREPEDLAPYDDPFTTLEEDGHAAGGVVAPDGVPQVQALVRLANRHKVPLWTVSRGKNLGYGGAAPRVKGSVILELSRMNRILHVDEKLAYCVVEPGVGFFQLQDYLDEHGIKLWMGSPGQSWGSVMGNALEHGASITPYGDHAQNICGLEVVLADGEIVRTGMGAMDGSPNWHVFRHAFGPGWDQMFTQSNFGIVTRMGFWLMPEPEATLTMNMEVEEAEGLRWIVDALGPLRTNGTIRQFVALRNFMRAATMNTRKRDWQQAPGALTDATIDDIKRRMNVGWWNINLRLYGVDGANRANAEAVQRAVAPYTDRRFEITTWQRGEPRERSGQSRPAMASMHKLNWPGGRGSFLTFSPVMPLDGRLALEQFQRTDRRMREYGFDYYGSAYLHERAMMVVSELYFDADDAEARRRLREVFPVLVADARQHGYGEYRVTVDYMDLIADTFDYNRQALRRLNERVKDALDPNGILSPGKQGIWPQGRRPRS